MEALTQQLSRVEQEGERERGILRHQRVRGQGVFWGGSFEGGTLSWGARGAILWSNGALVGVLRGLGKAMGAILVNWGSLVDILRGIEKCGGKFPPAIFIVGNLFSKHLAPSKNRIHTITPHTSHLTPHTSHIPP